MDRSRFPGSEVLADYFAGAVGSGDRPWGRAQEALAQSEKPAVAPTGEDRARKAGRFC